MFETMGQFYSFFIPTLILIILGIIFEEKLIYLEDRILIWIKRHIPKRRASHE